MNQRFTYTILPLSIPFADIYTFSAKEKDPETGLSYFGSRYYSSDLGIWLSVDPMAAKYPSLSPYVYCADNPGRVVDPNGEEINPIYDRFGYFLGTDDLGLNQRITERGPDAVPLLSPCCLLAGFLLKPC